MLTESFLAATLSANLPSQHLSAGLKDVGIFIHELQPQRTLRQGFKKSSVLPGCLAVSRSHIFAAQSSQAVVNVYSRERGNQESTVPFPERIRSVAYANGPEILILGTEEGKLLLWEVATGRMSTSTASHLQAITHLQVTPHDEVILSGSQDSTVQIWSVPRLLSFVAEVNEHSNKTAGNGPLATLSQHQAPITALGCGHSRLSTNFAVSASEDAICHIWHIQTCQVLRSVLLPSIPACITLDPADRAAFLGDTSGSIILIDILDLAKSAWATNAQCDLPTQLSDQQQWKSSANPGKTNCLSISYDGTFLVSGHANGVILRWDIAKHKIAAEMVRMGQPITNLEVLQPEGLKQNEVRDFQIPEVVKPKLEFTVQVEHGTSSIPASYKMHAVLNSRQLRGRSDQLDNIQIAMTSDGWPEAILNSAVEALARSAEEMPMQSASGSLHLTKKLEEEVADLRHTLAAYKEVEGQRRDHSIRRMAKREDVDLKRRQAYHDAIKQGKDKKTANAEMHTIMEASKTELAQIDAESDAEAFQDEMETR